MELGLKLFPVTPHKRPAMVGWQAYAVNATIDSIRNDWRNGYRAFGIYLKPSRIVVFDADNKAADLWADSNLPETPMMTLTRRGSHRYYRLPDGMAAPKDNRPIAGIPIDRKAKGYVIAPGSKIGGFMYEPVTFWDTPLSELPPYPAGLFPPERPIETCNITIADKALSAGAVAIAKWFIDNSEDSVEGENGSRVLKRAASFFVNGLALGHDDACKCLEEWNTHRAKPAWGAREMLHAIDTSAREGAITGRPRGWAYTDWAKS